MPALVVAGGTLTVVGQTPVPVAVGGATPLPGSLDEPPHVLVKSSLGMSFSTVPGTPTLIAQWETRVSDFEAFVAASGYRWNHKPPFPQDGSHPVVNVNLQDAMAFCTWLTEKDRAAGILQEGQSYRLPSNDEWTTAVGLEVGRTNDMATNQRIMDKQAHPWGPEWPPPADAGNYNSRQISGSDDGYVHTAPVGSFRASKEGLFDLGGNVWEWTYQMELSPSSQGVLRGGSWMYFVKETLLSSYEYKVPGDLRAPSIGFRCVIEDKKRTSIYLAETDKANKAASQARREQLASAPVVTQEDVKRRMEELASKPGSVTAGSNLPDPKKLKPVSAGKAYTNTLGMTLVPLEGEGKFLGETEVRIQDYEAALKEQGKRWDNKPPFAVRDSHPIINVSWAEATAFCVWLTINDRAVKLIPETASYRLPTDAEWSVAVGLKDEKGTNPAEKHLGDRAHYPWGDSATPPPASANLDTTKIQGYQDNYSYTSPVGSFSGDVSKFKDLGGNVLEWCQDPWPGATGERTLRGSSWLSSSPESLLSSYRTHLPESSTRPHVGFRVVLDLGTPAP